MEGGTARKRKAPLSYWYKWKGKGWWLGFREVPLCLAGSVMVELPWSWLTEAGAGHGFPIIMGTTEHVLQPVQPLSCLSGRCPDIRAVFKHSS